MVDVSLKSYDEWPSTIGLYLGDEIVGAILLGAVLFGDLPCRMD